MTLSTDALTLIGTAIREASGNPRTNDDIRTLHATAEGAEILRLIVRDDLGGAAATIVSALWFDL